MNAPLIVLDKLRKEFPAGEETLVVLKDVDLVIQEGEMVAIVGASGSGKSTLMNILGCLDRPTSGSYRIGDRETALLDPDELAELRREHFGFIFQRYHLLAELTAVGNVEIPAIYAGEPPAVRDERARALLERLGMGERTEHRPGQLSGGQQQRVSIARALMNGGNVILADEPTGALDRHSGEEVLRILDELHADGKTIIIVTHDMAVAERADRIIEISDGVIVGDRSKPAALSAPVRAESPNRRRRSAVGAFADRLREALQMALLSMAAHRLRTFLTMLGIIIGIASVVSVVALGAGSRAMVLANISSLGTNTLEVFPGKDFGDMRSGKIQTLVMGDARALQHQSYVAGVTPTVSTSSSVRFGGKEASALVNGVGEQYFEVRGSKLAEGRFFDQRSVTRMAQEVVIDDNTRTTFFADGASPIGEVLLIGNVPCRIVGVMQAQQGGFGSSRNLSLFLPYTTVQGRFTGSQSLRSITVRVADNVSPDLAEQGVTQLLTLRHNTKDFFILNTDDIRQTITSTTETLTLLIAAIAVISLVVGGIGVMNIMLVAVSERVSEIGVRMAVGGRRGDILQQFLIEAVLVCLIGGLAGVGAALAFGAVFSFFSPTFHLIYSTTSIVAACACSTAIGIVFGYLPARNASRLDPVVALARD
ncbi:MacB family efflux pump subunit [Consotaella salsifontis]|uniref:Pyoverdine export ATP-binding/permease protein PvdT n=1 Tax=Consotaella salsifontis TaxID=1365950 RepID=A0A1T4NZQ2_9HYPH|nr:MacB family efflux pump subunit [Consotaella salsifontis]SJZ84754.1 macrolide transport system ATP-binding/permease protein [Consotaella salsifontis]